MTKYLFPGFWVITALVLLTFSIIARDGQSAMTARVESRIVSVSFGRPVEIQKIHVVPGQAVSQGDLLFEAECESLNLDIEQKKNDLDRLQLQIASLQNEFARKKSEVDIEYTQKVNEIEGKIETLNIEHQTNLRNSKVVSKITGVQPTEDSLFLSKVGLLQQSILDLKKIKQTSLLNLEAEKTEKLHLLETSKTITVRELDNLSNVKSSLIGRASISGIIGNVYVDVNELVQSYNKLLTIYEEKPTQIKAFTNEANTSQIVSGTKVLVKASNREVTIEGVVEEVGTRITDYPTAMNPANNRYGQEIFIRISPSHSFLDGEQVFVYPIEEE